MLQNIGVIQTDKEEFSALTANPGFTGSTAISKIDFTGDDTAFYAELIGEYKPQNTISNERVSIRVAEVEANIKVLQINRVEDTLLLEGNDLKLVDVLSNPSALTPTFHNAFDNKLSAILEKSRLVMSGESISVNYNVVDGKITSQITQIIYNNKETANLEDNSLLQTQHLFANQINADKALSQDILETLDEKMLNQYPLIQNEQPCKTLDAFDPNSLSNIILSRTYSSEPQKTQEKLQEALKTYGMHSYTNDVIKGISLEIAQGESSPSVPSNIHYVLNGVTYFVTRSEPFKMVHCQDDAQLEKQAGNITQEIGGYYSLEYNVATFKGETAEEFSSYFIHEISHGLIHHLFKNEAKPFSADNSNQKSAYTLAELNVFKKVGLKLGLQPEQLADKNEVSEVIALLKTNTIIDLIEYQYNPSKVKFVNEAFEPHSLKNKYFINQDTNHVDFNEEQEVSKKLHEQMKVLKLGQEDYSVLTEFSRLIYDYKEDMLTTEVIVRIPQLLAEGIPLPHLEGYLKPLMEYWDNTVTPQVNLLFENHQAACQNTFETGHFLTSFQGSKYCIEEFVTLEV